MSLRLIVGGVSFDHLGKVFARFLYCKDKFIDLAIEIFMYIFIFIRIPLLFIKK